MRLRYIDSDYEAELQSLRERLLRMAGRVESMIGDAVRALVERDEARARETIDRDAEVNRDEMEIDALCLRILARRQPVAGDLRFITLALKIVTDLERIGDLAVNLCERAIQLNETRALAPLGNLESMGTIVRGMVRDGVDAFVSGDVGKARAVIARDDEADALYHSMFQETLERMVESSDRIRPGIHVLSVAKWLERMADHGTNLAEHVVFLVDGDDVRHSGKLRGDGA